MSKPKDPNYWKKFYALNRDKINARASAWYAKNKELVAARQKHRRENDLEFVARDNELHRVRRLELRQTDPVYRAKMNAKHRAAYRRKREHRIAYSKTYWHSRKNDPEFKAKEKEARRRRRPFNREKSAAANKIWRAKNKDKVSAIQMRYNRKLWATPEGAIHARISSGVRNSLAAIQQKKERRSWPSFLGYTAEQLKVRLESQFVNGMTWEKLIDGQIHIDHVIPKSKFKFTSVDDIEFKRCWALENLQPLWASDNTRKRDKILSPAQIPLGV